MLLKKPFIFVIILLLISGGSYAQLCTTLGQNPSTAFPVCGTSVFHQDSVPFCNSNKLYTPGCSIYGVDTTYYSNKNPYWYKFTCFQSGTLCFIITPNGPFEDYDWQLYDITGHNPDDVYTDTSLVVTGNWAGTYDSTGASATGVNYIQCSSEPTDIAPTFALSPNLIQGHNYLLLVSHFYDTHQGYTLSFGGGTAGITDGLPPHMFTASRATCDGSKILVKLNKKMRCNSLAANGSDFKISPAAATIISAVGYGCTAAFDMDSVLLTFNGSLPVGNYNLIAQNGSDANTITDLCADQIPVGEMIPFTVLSPLPVPFDSLTNNKCSSDSLTVVFPDLIKCSSVAVDGSDFFVTGSYPVGIGSANAVNCIGGLTKQVVVHFTSTLFQAGNFKIILKKGNDGNTVLSECDTASVAGSAIPFTILPKPVANFAFTDTVCLPEGKVFFANKSSITDGSENLLRYLWNFNDSVSGINNTSTQKTPTHFYTNTGPYHVSLKVTSNAGCVKDTILLVNTIHNQPLINFGIRKSEICLEDAVFLTDSTKNINAVTEQWNWDLGDSKLRNTQNVLYIYTEAKTYNVSFYTVNNWGCRSATLIKPITVYPYPVIDAGPDRKVLEGNNLTIEAVANGIAPQYLWTPSQYLNNPTVLKPVAEPKFDITYTLTVTGKGGCSVSDNMFIDVLKIPQIPNTFSPNNDRTNDYWVIKYLDEYSNNHLQVFTRAGQLVFESRGQYKPWDGTYKGKPLPVDTYYYIIEPGNGREPVSGYVMIVK